MPFNRSLNNMGLLGTNAVLHFLVFAPVFFPVRLLSTSYDNFCQLLTRYDQRGPEVIAMMRQRWRRSSFKTLYVQ
jgi:hypothetical protein